ncbi:MAG: CtsR family transcriptional regulator [Synergistaceae bacterium]|nr:CtsR family transcriptional regulator [Synergistaceae bacterium]
MASLTREIEKYIEQLLEAAEAGDISLSRKGLAEHFDCVPSQINYVLRSRFAPENGFLVESQRGGHGYIRILRLDFSTNEEKVEHLESLIGGKISETDARRLLLNLQNRNLISLRERLLIEVALRDQEEKARDLFEISIYKRDVLRADTLKRLLTSLALV